MEIIGIIILSIIIVWIILVAYQWDRQIPTGNIPNYKKVVVIFPHPDDESLSCGGTLYKLSKKGCEVVLVVLTKGERGVEGAHLTPKLKPIRTKEMIDSAKYLGVTKLIHEDYGDGELEHKQTIVTSVIDKTLEIEQPDLVITYDQSGLYGHPDHIIVSEITTKLITKNYQQTQLWYISRPQKMYDRMNLPVHMAKDPDFLSRRMVPTLKIRLTPFALIAKIMSLMSHQSQHFAFKKSRPAYLPLWFTVSTQIYEYFYVTEPISKPVFVTKLQSLVRKA